MCLEYCVTRPGQLPVVEANDRPCSMWSDGCQDSHCCIPDAATCDSSDMCTAIVGLNYKGQFKETPCSTWPDGCTTAHCCERVAMCATAVKCSGLLVPEESFSSTNCEAWADGCTTTHCCRRTKVQTTCTTSLVCAGSDLVEKAARKDVKCSTLPFEDGCTQTNCCDPFDNVRTCTTAGVCGTGFVPIRNGGTTR